MVVFFLSPEFSFRQISANFQLEIGQREGLLRIIIVFRPTCIVSACEMVFFKKILFRCSFFFAPNFRFAQIGATFRLEMGQQIGLYKRFIIFQPNSIISASEMAFFLKFSFQCAFFFLRQNLDSRKLWSFSSGNGSTAKTLKEVHRFSSKFRRFGLRNGIFF